MFLKLTNLLKDQVAPRLTPGRPQLIFIDALDESEPTATGRTAFQRIPEDLPAGVYIIATTRPVTDRVSLARRPFCTGSTSTPPTTCKTTSTTAWSTPGASWPTARSPRRRSPRWPASPRATSWC